MFMVRMHLKWMRGLYQDILYVCPLQAASLDFDYSGVYLAVGSNEIRLVFVYVWWTFEQMHELAFFKFYKTCIKFYKTCISTYILFFLASIYQTKSWELLKTFGGNTGPVTSVKFGKYAKSLVC